MLQGFYSHNIRDAVIYKDIIFLATDNGLVRYQQTEDSWKTLDRFDGLRSTNLSSLAVGGGFLFIGSDNGINRYTLPNGPMWGIGYKPSIAFATLDLAADEEFLWAGGEQGTFRIPSIKTSESESEVLNLDNEPARAVTIIDDKVWIASNSGVRAVDKKTGSDVVQLGYHGYLNCKDALALAGDNNYLWIGTGSGLIRYDYHSSRRLTYGMKEGLPDDRIQCLTLEADSLWIGTPAGLTRFIWNRPERDGDY